MINIELALRLRDAGLKWQPQERDQFVLPDRQMDQQIFVLGELAALVQKQFGEPVVAFHGASEWALDHVVVTEVVWLPTETQLREQLAARLGPDAPLRLSREHDGYRCAIALGATLREFSASNGETAYGLALLAVLEESPN